MVKLVATDALAGDELHAGVFALLDQLHPAGGSPWANPSGAQRKMKSASHYAKGRIRCSWLQAAKRDLHAARIAERYITSRPHPAYRLVKQLIVGPRATSRSARMQVREPVVCCKINE